VFLLPVVVVVMVMRVEMWLSRVMVFLLSGGGDGNEG
jgi:hypothetical protein